MNTPYTAAILKPSRVFYITTIATAALYLLPTQQAAASWIWADWGGDAANPSGTSGSFQLSPLYANYDNGDGSPGLDANNGLVNEVDGRGWDRTPEDFTFSWSSTGGEIIEIDQASSSSGGFNYMEVLLDPDGNATLPDTLTLTVMFPFDLVVRGLGGGGLGLNMQPIAMTMDATLETYHGDGSKVMLDNTYSYQANGDPGPDSYSSGTAVWDDLSGAGKFFGLDNSNLNASTYFPFVNSATTPDQSKTLGQMTWNFSDFSGGDTFRLSFDGGVPVLAQTPVPVPEPSSAALLGLGALALLLGRSKN